MTPSKFTRDSGNRLRYRGQGRRGNPGALRPAIVDLTHAIEALTAARDELEVSLHDERRRDRLVDSARSRVTLGIKFAGLALTGRKPKRTAPATQLKLNLARR